MPARLWRCALGLAAVLTAGAEAAPLALDGITFSDELGGVELLDGWGRGTLEEPFVLVERITGGGPAVLVVRGMSRRFGNRIRSHHDTGFALTKIVHNATGQPWSMFDLELRESLERPSPFGDGLSFGQASLAGRPFGSDRFKEYQEIEEPYDAVSFQDGLVGPGASATFEVVITDTTPTAEFFLLQRRDTPLAMRARRDGPNRCADRRCRRRRPAFGRATLADARPAAGSGRRCSG